MRVFVDLSVFSTRKSCQKLNSIWAAVNNDACGHSWGDSPKICPHDCVTRENFWRITPLMTTKIVINGTPYTILHIIYKWLEEIWCSFYCEIHLGLFFYLWLNNFLEKTLHHLRTCSAIDRKRALVARVCWRLLAVKVTKCCSGQHVPGDLKQQTGSIFTKR